MNFVPCVKWVKMGVAKSVPDKLQLTSKELKALWDANKDKIEATKEEIQKFTNGEDNNVVNNETNSDIYDLENYDNEPENTENVLNFDSLVSMNSTQQTNEEEDEDDSEIGDEIIHADDNLIVVGHVEEDASVLEVYVYNEKNGDMYVHHDILLPHVPLCLEWLNFKPLASSPGNLVAVGGLCPEIMFWDLDIVNCLEPAFKLGRFSKKSSKKPEKQNIGHKDAVLDISWNKNASHVLASASVDQSVIVWDMEERTVAMHLTDFSDKVQCVTWHPHESQTFLSGCCDKYVRMFDCRVDPLITKRKVSGEVESICWNSAESWEALIGTNNGMIYCVDFRTKKCKWKLMAHEKEITGLSMHDSTPELLVSCSTDGSLKLWDISKTEPSLKSSRAVNSGELYCLDLNPDISYLACTGGSKKSNVFCVTDLRK